MKNDSQQKCSRFIVKEPMELMAFLALKMPERSRNGIKSLLANKQVSVNNEVISQYNHKLLPEYEVLVNWAKKISVSQPKKLKILFEDDSIIVVEKEAGLLSIATDKEHEQTAYSILTEYVSQINPVNRIFIVHRLDRETSGVMLFARTKEVQDKLQENWQHAVSERKYLAVVEGTVLRDSGTITSWLKENGGLLMYSSSTPGDGQKAITLFKVLKRNSLYSMLEIELQTGRKNQIRVHMSDNRHPIIGDKRYGSKVNPINRLGLHAKLLAFKHPITGEEMRFETDAPSSFAKLF